MNGLHSKRNDSTDRGFTIIEVMIVLVLAAIILSIVLFAVPALQRNSRNTRRDQDAAMIATAINECMTTYQQLKTRCDERDEIDFDDSKLSLYTGFHYGRDGSGGPVIPTMEEPNWLFKLRCNANHTWFDDTDSSTTFVVTYYRENPDGTAKSRCIEG